MSHKFPLTDLDDGISEVHPPPQQAVEVVPLLLQGAQICLDLSLGLFVPHGEELPAQLQSVDESALIPLEQQLGMLWKRRREKLCTESCCWFCFVLGLSAFYWAAAEWKENSLSLTLIIHFNLFTLNSL